MTKKTKAVSETAYIEPFTSAHTSPAVLVIVVDPDSGRKAIESHCFHHKSCCIKLKNQLASGGKLKHTKDRARIKKHDYEHLVYE